MDDQSPEVAATVDALRLELQSAQSTIAGLRQHLSEVDLIRTGAVELASALQVRLAEAQAAATAAIAIRTQIADEQAVIATKSAHIQNAQEHADKIRAELDRVQTAAIQSATEADGHKRRAQSAVDVASELLAEIRAQKASVQNAADTVAELQETAAEASSVTKKLADRSDNIEKKLAEYEAALVDLRKQSEDQLQTITGLLPGATAAGLAHAFDDRRKTFLQPSRRWQWLFVGSVACLVILAISGLYNVYKGNSVLGWDELARLWIARLPIAGALIWLALHASREAALSKRLEEDYGYKAAIAASFLGFQRQMAKIGEDVSEGSPLSQLCQDTLETIGSPPGRIYDRHRLTVSPAGELADAAAGAAKTGLIGKPQ
ncbi:MULTISPECIES: hypothetical protein [unclassified Rubrivivax]|uniref:hypothetical protein n=1 Tax=unclassified Rubrivivax TaxID=2649762 RepID=UPI001E48515E|nr:MULTISPECIES: hypothetical protein [unclassified Rubrivivax]MCC9597253.1 hypothetical protein [Rubrivivax sp. JA1055]MCC9646489.1 hypothetical protein [Rubrivivax sp. JA1029]